MGVLWSGESFISSKLTKMRFNSSNCSVHQLAASSLTIQPMALSGKSTNSPVGYHAVLFHWYTVFIRWVVKFIIIGRKIYCIHQYIFMYAVKLLSWPCQGLAEMGNMERWLLYHVQCSLYIFYALSSACLKGKPVYRLLVPLWLKYWFLILF